MRVRARAHSTQTKKLVVLSDLQIPWEDPTAVHLALNFIDGWKPDTVILNGDVADCYALSHFAKDPAIGETLPDEIDRCKQLLSLLVAKVPKVIWLGGNHEHRWTRALWAAQESQQTHFAFVKSVVAALGVDNLDPDALFRIVWGPKSAGVDYWPWGDYLLVANDNLVITHGFLVSMHSAFSAKRHMERLGKSVIIGHTHRLGSYLLSNMDPGVPRGAWENGCLCRLDPQWVQFPNWQQGFSVVEVDGPRFQVTQVPIIATAAGGRALHFGGQTWSTGPVGLSPLAIQS